MARIPMTLQLALILFGVMAIPIAILTWYSDTRMIESSESAIAETALSGQHASRKLAENALQGVAQDVVRLTSTKVFDRIRDYETFAEVNDNYGNVSNALVVLKELASLNRRTDGVYSSYFYLSDSNYVVSTDKGITRLDRYESFAWTEEALADRRGIGGVWVPRKLDSGIPVVSYVLPLNRLSTTTRGMVVVNMRERQLAQYLHASEPGKHGYLLMEEDGTIISHADKSLLLTDGKQLPFIPDIVNNRAREGYAFRELSGERVIYAWSRSELFKWWNVNVYSMDELLADAHTLRRGINAITILIVFAGTLLAVTLATWLSRPARKLVRAVRSHARDPVGVKNELAFLEAAFRRMQAEEEGLHKLLQEREQDTRSLAVHHVLRGDVTEQLAGMFPERHYRVAVVSVDRYRHYANDTNPETRSYHRYVLMSRCDGAFPDTVHARSVYQGDGSFAIVINYGQHQRPDDGMEELRGAFEAIRDQASLLFGHSVTIGVSSQAESSVALAELAAQAMDAVKRRIVAGSGAITFWKPEPDGSPKYMYPTNSERRILNFLDKGDHDSIIQELSIIRGDIQAADYIAYDNILFIYNQLAGVTIKHLRETHSDAARLFAGRSSIYSAIAALDTLEELEAHLCGFFGEIVQHLTRNKSNDSYGERIIRYLEEHYCEDIVYEDMAKEIGISYSYMRKIAYELTGKSLIDYTNQLRIEKAKRIMLECNKSMMQIASEVGYYNVQSFNRFFRKYEGMTPSSYKALKAEA